MATDNRSYGELTWRRHDMLKTGPAEASQSYLEAL
jgi:hypothetical protein